MALDRVGSATGAPLDPVGVQLDDVHAGERDALTLADLKDHGLLALEMAAGAVEGVSQRDEVKLARAAALEERIYDLVRLHLHDTHDSTDEAAPIRTGSEAGGPKCTRQALSDSVISKRATGSSLTFGTLAMTSNGRLTRCPVWRASCT